MRSALASRRDRLASTEQARPSANISDVLARLPSVLPSGVAPREAWHAGSEPELVFELAGHCGYFSNSLPGTGAWRAGRIRSPHGSSGRARSRS